LAVRIRPRWLAAAAASGTADADSTRSLAGLVAACVPGSADYCAIDLVVPAGLRRAGRAGGGSADDGPAGVAESAEAHGGDAPGAVRTAPAAGDGLIGRVLGSGNAVLATSITAGDLPAAGEEERSRLERLPSLSAIVVPIVLRRGTLAGVITLVLGRDGAVYDAESLADAEELAAQAALLLESERLARAARSATRARSEFLAIVSHELRTPLNIILGYTELMLSGIPDALSAETTHQVERIRGSARYLLQRIEEVLSYARLEGGRESVRRETVAIHALIPELAELIAPLADAKRLTLDVPPPPELEIASDATHLRQLLLHLLSNAVRFTDRGTIRFAAEAVDGGVRFEVSDTGRGMTEEEIGRIFDPFWQADPLATRRAQGAGLGLSIALRLVRLLDGDIACRSEPGVGSTFTVQLPLQPLPAEPGGN
jgi:signal transduction histidine kinase